MTLRTGFRSKQEELEWCRSKIIELKSQGLDQRKIANILQVTPAVVSYDVQCMRNEAKENIRDYTTRRLPLQMPVMTFRQQIDELKRRVSEERYYGFV